jgi:hypothetical protein
MSYELTTEAPRLKCPLVDDPSFEYVPAAKTDITQTWRKFGWKPLAERQGEMK